MIINKNLTIQDLIDLLKEFEGTGKDFTMVEFLRFLEDKYLREDA